MAFTKTPRSIGRLSLLAGTRKIDKITGLGGTAAFTGDGNDLLTGRGVTRKGYILPSLLVGGNGDDRYVVERGSFSVISDQGNGNDTLDLSALFESSTYFIRLDKGVIVISDGNTIVAVHEPFSGKKTEIEKVIFSGKTWTPNSLYSYAIKRGASLGASTFASLERLGLFNFPIVGLSSSGGGIDSIISAASYNSQIIA